MTWWQATLLGLLQGLTEFLPVSSSGHLVLAQYLFGLDAAMAEEVTFEVFVHFGTAMSILTVYWKRITAMTATTLRSVANPTMLGAQYRESEEMRLAVLVLVSMIPTAIVYVIFKDNLEAAFADPRLVSGMLMVTGVLLLLTGLRRNPSGEVNGIKALVIGIAQSVAMIPGISRSGATICTGIYMNVDRVKAADFSFLMVLPVILGATLLKALEMFDTPSAVGPVALLLATAVAYVSGVWAIRVVIQFVKRGNLRVFAYYCLVVGLIGLLFIRL